MDESVGDFHWRWLYQYIGCMNSNWAVGKRFTVCMYVTITEDNLILGNP